MARISQPDCPPHADGVHRCTHLRIDHHGQRFHVSTVLAVVRPHPGPSPIHGSVDRRSTGMLSGFWFMLAHSSFTSMPELGCLYSTRRAWRLLASSITAP